VAAPKGASNSSILGIAGEVAGKVASLTSAAEATFKTERFATVRHPIVTAKIAFFRKL
jgi:hypothetical protein